MSLSAASSSLLVSLSIFFVLLLLPVPFAQSANSRPYGNKRPETSGGGFVGPRRADSIRLPRHFKPSHYDLTLVPWLDDQDFTFSGEVDIRIICEDPDLTSAQCTNITVHSRSISINDVSVETLDGNAVEIEPNMDYDPYTEWSTIYLTSGINPGNEVLLKMAFTGTMSTAVGGLFYRSYTDNTAAVKYLAVTQMQPESARSAFPCFDEPNMKATFQINIGRRQDRKSHSNMPLLESVPAPEIHPEYVLDRYETTPVMSNYLVIVAVGEYESAQSERDPRQELLFKPGRRASAAYALDLVVDAVNYYEAYYGIPFALPKLGHIAIENFGGAMENYGLITYDETVLLVDPNDPNVEDLKDEIFLYVSHEIGHQWTGNLVTTDWWDTIWLNEGITEYMTYYSGETVDPDEDWEAILAISVMNRAIAMDADPEGNNFALVLPVDKPSDFNDAFQFTRIYEKGACVIRMMAYMLTQATFRKGMGYYLGTHGGGSVVEERLWSSMERAADEDGTQPGFELVADIMRPWTNQAGVPVVTINRDYEANYAVFSQKRLLNVSNNEHESPELWPIFVTFELGGLAGKKQDAATTIFLDAENVQVDLFLGLDEEIKNAWLLANPKREGYYVVNYDTLNWIKLINQLIADPSVIDPINRAQVLSDLVILCAQGNVDPDVCAMAPAYLVTETHPIPWLAAAQMLPKWRGSTLNTAEYDAFLPPLIELAMETIRQKFAEQFESNGSDKGETGPSECAVGSGKHKVDSKRMKKTMNMLTSWLGHLRRYGSKQGVTYVPELLRTLDKRKVGRKTPRRSS